MEHKMEKVHFIVKAKSKKGTGICDQEDNWYNLNGYAKPKPSYDNVNPGDEVTLLVNEKGFASKVHIHEGTRSEASSDKPIQKLSEVKGPIAKQPWGSKDPTTQSIINRAAAVKAVLDSPLVYEMYKGCDEATIFEKLEFMVKRVSSFIDNGTFGVKHEEKVEKEAEVEEKDEAPKQEVAKTKEKPEPKKRGRKPKAKVEEKKEEAVEEKESGSSADGCPF